MHPEEIRFRRDGPCEAVICAPMWLTVREILAEANGNAPTVVRWRVREATGEQNPRECPHDRWRVHYELSC
jgi:hypothetical protein